MSARGIITSFAQGAKVTTRLTLCKCFAAAILFALQPNLVWPQKSISYRIDESSLSGVVSNPIIQSFDLSPDGKTVALLAVAGSRIGAPLWLVTEDITTNRINGNIELGTSVFPAGGFAPQVLYASDQQYLVVQDLQQVRVFDASSLKSLRTISGPSAQPPLFVLAASKSNTAVCAFGSPGPPEFGVHVTPARLEVVDVTSGKLLSEWASDDVPQAISTDGEMIAISSSHVQKGLLPLIVFDNKGKRLAELDGGFSFRKVGDQSKPLGRVRGLFVGDEEILLSPDENVDATGRASGDNLQLVSITNKEIQQKIRPPRFKSTGEMAISKDQRTVLVVSWYISALTLRHDWALPGDSSPEALVFRRDPSFHMDADFPLPAFGLKASGWLENRRPRLSSDGSVIAIAQASGVTVSIRNPRP